MLEGDLAMLLQENCVPSGSSQFNLLKRTSSGGEKLSPTKQLSVETTARDTLKTLTCRLRTVNHYIDYLGKSRADDVPVRR